MMSWLLKCDESCIGKGHKYLAVSGIAISSSDAQKLSTRIDAWRDRVNMKAELKWGKVTDKKVSEYKQFVDGGIGWTRRKALAFRSVLFLHDDIRYREFHDGSEELGLFRFTYQLVLHCLIPQVPSGQDIVVHLDRRNLSDRSLIGDFESALRWGIRKQYGYQRNRVSKVEQHDSKLCNLLQLNDVLMGAVQYQNNGRHLTAGCRSAKVLLAEHVAERVGLPTLCVNTPKPMTHFGIWLFKFRTRGAESA